MPHDRHKEVVWCALQLLLFFNKDNCTMENVQLDKVFINYKGLVDFLKSRGLSIKDELLAVKILSTVSYYDLVNGYKELFIDPNTEEFNVDISIEELYSFLLLDKGIQNILFKYSVFVETAFKTALAYVISKNISEDDFFYMSPNMYKRKNYRKLKTTLQNLSNVCNNTMDNPTRYYREKHNHTPPWILFKNVTFSTCIDLSDLLIQRDRQDLVSLLVPPEIEPSAKSLYLKDCLNTVRRFRNAIAHNLKFVTMRVSGAQKLTYSRMKNVFNNTLLIPSDKGVRCNGDPFSMILAILSIINEETVIKNFFYDLADQFKRFNNNSFYELYCKYTGIPEDILQRGTNFTNKL